MASAQESWDACYLETVVSEQEINDALDAMAEKIAAKHSNNTRPLVVVPVLKGGVFPGVELVKRLGKLGCASRIDFLWMASYDGDGSTGKVTMLADLQSDIEGDDVLIVDDLIDTGLTLAEAVALCELKMPKTVSSAVLLEKLGVERHPKAADLHPEFIGVQIPKKFVVGAFMDFNEHFRSHHELVVFDKTKMETLQGGMSIDLTPGRSNNPPSPRSKKKGADPGLEPPADLEN